MLDNPSAMGHKSDMLPRVILHTAVSADGRIDWFTPDVGMYYELASRFNEDATLAGADTLLSVPDEVPADDPQVMSPPRDPNDRRPLLVVPDSKGRIRSWNYWRSQAYWRDVVVLCSHATPQAYLDYLLSVQVDYIKAGREQVDLRAALEELAARYGTKTVRVDSGGTLNGALLRAGVVNEVSILVHPTLVGGLSPKSLYRAADLTSAEGIISLKLAHLEQMADDVIWLRYEVVN